MSPVWGRGLMTEANFSGNLPGRDVGPGSASRKSCTMTNRKRILIVEDEMVLAMLIEDMVHELGYEPIGPAMTLESALTLSAEDLDGAILDMNLGAGRPSTPVAEKLRSRGVPFIFATGYGSNRTGAIGETQVLTKPFSIQQLSDVLERVVG